MNRIIKLVKTILFIASLAVILNACKNTSDKHTKLTAEISKPIQYINSRGEIFTARYGSLQDNTLNFVKITMPDGKQYTLPQVVSASGVRFTDEREIQWWLHHGSVRLDTRNNEGEWQTKYSNLKEIQ